MNCKTLFFLSASTLLMLPATLLAQVNLTGTVVDQTGAPIEGARVWIQTAAPKSGKGYL